MRRNTVGIALLTALLFALDLGSAFSAAETKGGASMELKSSAFQNGADIPVKYTCDGKDISPPLSWVNVPGGTKALALIADDPDAPVGTWVHWVIYDLPADAKELPEGIATTETLADGSKQGVNDFRKTGYGGPCPPPGTAHRYYFKLYALSAPTEVKPRATKQRLLQAIKSYTLGEAQLMGRYKR